MSDPHLDHHVAVERLGRSTTLVIILTDGLPDELMRWKPAADRWSMLEVVNHLADEEVSDFRARVESTLRDPAEAWPSIDPQSWVVARKYNEQGTRESLDRFLAERKQSVDWLRTLKSARWENAHVHPKLGPLSARMLLANWIAHDLLHARQLMRLHYEWLAAKIAPEKLDYAGPWS
ncbi:MAG TPA: DinB family protein [Planctomycetota bacterium]|nr:DinB family protein [Planctomycetota bacterium]